MFKKPITTEYKTLTAFIADLERVAAIAEVEPEKMTLAIYIKNGGTFTANEIRRLGYMQNIIKAQYGYKKEDENLVAVRGQQLQSSYVKKLRNQLGDDEVLYNKFKFAFLDALKQYPIKITSKEYKVAKPKNPKRYNCGLISDTHFGVNVDPEEIQGNEYSWPVAARRLGCFVQSLADYKADHRNECEGLVLNFGGDLIQGQIHLEDHNVDQITWQIRGASDYIIQSIDYLLKFYPKIVVPVTSDNHARMTNAIKGKDRSRAQKFDSFNSIMFFVVQEAFRNNRRVEFLLPKTPYTQYSVFGRNFLLTHGDTFIDIGFPASKINVDSITAQLNKVSHGLSKNNQISVFMFGHVHTGVYMILDNGIHMIVNPSMSGVDPYAQSVGFVHNHPGQWLWESTTEHAVGDTRLVRLSDADGNRDFEKIINPFDYSLVVD